MKKYSQIKDDIIYKKGQEYADHLFKFLKSYEDIIINTKSRQRKKKKNRVNIYGVAEKK